MLTSVGPEAESPASIAPKFAIAKGGNLSVGFSPNKADDLSAKAVIQSGTTIVE
jgi:hypothetical protein